MFFYQSYDSFRLDKPSIQSVSWNQSGFTEKPATLCCQFRSKNLRKLWHNIVVPPLIAIAKRAQYEEALKNKNSSNGNGSKIVDVNEDDDPPYIDYKRATEEFLRRLFTELIGTMILTTMIGANLLEARLKLITGDVASFNNGLVILFLIYPLGGISGAHFNPVVTFAFTLRRVFPRTWLPFYVLSQFVGSIFGGLLIRALFGGQYASLATNSVDVSTSTLANGLKWEIFLTFCLVFTVLQTATKSAIIGSQAAIAVGSVLAVTSLISGKNSTGSMNPWRTLGPSIINNSPDNRRSLWIHIVGPILGSFLSYFAASFVQGFRRQVDEVSAAFGQALNAAPDDADRSALKMVIF